MNLTSIHERASPDNTGDKPNDDSFEAFYRGQVDRVYRALALTLGSADMAREATDEGMARAYARWHKISSFDNPGGWEDPDPLSR